MPSKHIWLNGEMVPREDAVVSLLDHGFLYGDGCHEALVVRSCRAFMLDEHLARFRRSLTVLKIAAGFDRDELLDALGALMGANDLTDAYVKIVVSRGKGDLPIMTPVDLTPNRVVFADSDPNLHPRAVGGIRLKTSSYRRNAADGTDPRVKTLNYLNSILPKIEAMDVGADDALLLDAMGKVAEPTGANVLVVADGSVIVPDSTQALEGVTRHAVLLLCDDLGVPVERGALHTSDVYGADEVFLASTAGGVIPVGSVDGRDIGDGGPGPLTRQLRARHDEEMLGERWTTPLSRR